MKILRRKAQLESHFTPLLAAPMESKIEQGNPNDGRCAPSLPPVGSPVTHLPRGGMIVDTRAGAVQFGGELAPLDPCCPLPERTHARAHECPLSCPPPLLTQYAVLVLPTANTRTAVSDHQTYLSPVPVPPNTIKDTMGTGRTVPQIYVVTRHMFDRHKGVNVAEVEFPAYFSFFIKQKKVTFIVEDGVEERIRTVFRETLLGPESYDLDQELGADFDRAELPDLARECAALRTFDNIDELMTFEHFDEDGVATIGEGVQVCHVSDDVLSVVQDSQEIARVPARTSIPPR